MKLAIEQLPIYTGHKAAIYAMANKQDGHSFYSADGNGWLVEWSVRQPNKGKVIAQIPSNIFSLFYIPQASLLVAGTMAGIVYMYHADKSKLAWPPIQLGGAVFDTYYFAPTNHLFFTCGDGSLWKMDIETGQTVGNVKLSTENLRCCIGLPNPDNNKTMPCLAVGASNGCIYIVNAQNLEIVQTVTAAHNSSVFCLAFAQKANELWTGGRDAQINIWDCLPSAPNLFLPNKANQQIPAHLYTVNALYINEAQNWVVSASRDKSLKWWHLPSKQLLQVIDPFKPNYKGHLKSVNALCFFPEENILLSAGDDRQILSWKISVGF